MTDQTNYRSIDEMMVELAKERWGESKRVVIDDLLRELEAVKQNKDELVRLLNEATERAEKAEKELKEVLVQADRERRKLWHRGQ